MPERMIIHWEPVLPRDQPRGELDVTWRWEVGVGRGRDCELVLKHPSIPLKQGRFLRLRNNWWVEELNNPNGIYIHGKKIHLEPVLNAAVDFGMIARLWVETIPMSAEELRLREAIRAALDDDARFLVYADWLQEQDDEVGQLMVSPAPIAARWLGPLFSPGIEVKWRHGFLDVVKVRSAQSIFGKTGVFNEVTAHPLCAFLRTLEVDAVLMSAEVDYVPEAKWVVELLTTLKDDAPQTLRQLKVRLPSEHRLGLEAMFDEARMKLPALETTWDNLFTEGALP